MQKNACFRTIMWTGRRTTTSFANHGLLMKHALSKGISRNLVPPALMEEEMTPAALSMPIAKGAIRLNRYTSPGVFAFLSYPLGLSVSSRTSHVPCASFSRKYHRCEADNNRAACRQCYLRNTLDLHAIHVKLAPANEQR